MFSYVKMYSNNINMFVTRLLNYGFIHKIHKPMCRTHMYKYTNIYRYTFIYIYIYKHAHM